MTGNLFLNFCAFQQLSLGFITNLENAISFSAITTSLWGPELLKVYAIGYVGTENLSKYCCSFQRDIANLIRPNASVFLSVFGKMIVDTL